MSTFRSVPMQIQQMQRNIYRIITSDLLSFPKNNNNSARLKMDEIFTDFVLYRSVRVKTEIFSGNKYFFFVYFMNIIIIIIIIVLVACRRLVDPLSFAVNFNFIIIISLNLIEIFRFSSRLSN